MTVSEIDCNFVRLPLSDLSANVIFFTFSGLRHFSRNIDDAPVMNHEIKLFFTSARVNSQ